MVRTHFLVDFCIIFFFLAGTCFTHLLIYFKFRITDRVTGKHAWNLINPCFYLSIRLSYCITENLRHFLLLKFSVLSNTIRLKHDRTVRLKMYEWRVIDKKRPLNILLGNTSFDYRKSSIRSRPLLQVYSIRSRTI